MLSHGRASVKTLLALNILGIALFAGSGVKSDELSGAMVNASPAVSTAPVGSLDTLSPGNRLIAQALFNAQKATAVTGLQSWSLERIVTTRGEGRNWGEIFAQLKRDGLVEAETLGQVVTWYQYHNVVPTRAEQEPRAAVAVKVVTQPGPAQ